MVHSKEFNAERRRQYALGIAKGLTPREAGHLYNDRQAAVRVARALAQPPPKTPVAMPPLQRRLEAAIAKSPGKNVGYPFHNRHLTYVKVGVKFKSRETGQTEKRYLTVTSNEKVVPTRAELLTLVERVVAKHSGQHIYREYDVAGITYEDVYRYEDAGSAFVAPVGPNKGRIEVIRGTSPSTSQQRLD